ncbi:putative transcriptional regulator, MarR family protein [Streptomyces spiroverticillatus]|uniref:Transcriptional regulator, MarR family protein n=1 Tax=Streptomyces finlayi TaxID=67296 RepID=A0A918WWK6_9ACTN|nr:MarR family winged helix-turn-helix transcriptional regulator [Streptomyces finlayi]GHA07700.1 putative transcriptional regulator, MarR family protein [Streptomyces spiroverticillatus]GHC90970.1 putative transcriptional regulator, MarR family protein [Streptomyces finlayi]
MTDDLRSRDLAAMLQPLLNSLVKAELPVLAAHDLTMWGYTVLGALGDGPVRTQAALCEVIGADKTRIISTLDKLQEAGLISRLPDPADRRVRLLSITEEGREVLRSVRTEIRAGEDRTLAALPAADRRGFLRALNTLSEELRPQA